MKQLIHKIRQLLIINIPIRYILKFITFVGNKSYKFSSSHWLLSGVAKIELPNEKSLLIYSKADDYIPSQIYWKGFDAYEYAVTPFFYLAEKANTIIDIGANIGYFSLIASAANKSSEIYSFEPVERIVRRFEKQKKINAFTNIKIEPMIIGDNNDKQVFYIPEGNEMALAGSTKKGWMDKADEIFIQSTTLDSYKEKHNLNKIDLIKMDCEFHEVEALNGMKEILKLDKPNILMEVLFPESKGVEGHFENNQFQEIEKIMLENNYYFYLITKEALLRVDKLEYNHIDRNYIFSPTKSKNQFIPHNLVAEMLIKTH